MQNIKYKLIKLYLNEKYDEWLELFNEYLDKGYGVDFETIRSLIIILSKKGEFDKAAKILKGLEKSSSEYELDEEIAQLYFLCRKGKDALRIYNSYKGIIKKYGTLARIYLLNGLIDEAYNISQKVLLIEPDNDELLEVQYKVENNRKYGSYIETEYSCFLEQGKKLEVGHIVFLKKSPILCDNTICDIKAVKRPFLVARINDNELTLFPISTNCREQDYKLYSQNYLNSVGDRRLIDEIYTTTKDNVYSVEDKLTERDLYNIINHIYYKLHYRKDNSSIASFLKYVMGEPCIGNIVELVDKDTKIHRFFYILSKNNNKYNTIEIDYKELEPLSGNIRVINNDEVYYSIKRISKSQIELLLYKYYKLLDTYKGLILC